MVNNTVVCGGTFDHFHKGHEKFLNYALSLGGRLIIGVTGDNFVKSEKRKAKSEKQIEPFEVRRQSVLEFVKKEKALSKTEIIKIEDLFGPTLSKEILIDAIVVSNDTKKGAEIINKKRKELGLKDLRILVTPQVLAKDGKLISSDRIRRGEVNRAGRLYVKPSWLKTDMILPENLRQELKKPFGDLIFNVPKRKSQFSWIISVGDVTTKRLNELFVWQKISVVDFKVARKKAFDSFVELGFSGDEEILIANNPPGQITHDLFSKVLNIFKLPSEKKIILKIEGEDDLAVLPLILTAPLGDVIYYGQPPLPAFAEASAGKQNFSGQAGMVKVTVSEESKERAYNLVSKLKPA